ncbi:MAG: hypothetical protein WC979_00840 [Candidatus Pacearchaeota archaeon]|jgi:hypothetical protein|nr:hypothetical protein [Clostridia bacterium]
MISGKQIKNASVTIAKLLVDSDLSMNGHAISNVSIPQTDNDVATKIYVDTKTNVASTKEPVDVATTTVTELQNTNNSPYTYNAETAGEGTDYWGNIINPKSIDGVSITDGFRILIKNASDAKGNGIWTYNVTNNKFYRASDCDNVLPSSNEVRLGMTCFVNKGNVNKGAGYILSAAGGSPIAANGIYNLGTDTLTFNQFNGIGILLAGNGISKIGNTISVLYDDTTIGWNSTALYVKNSGITATQLSNNAVTNGKIYSGAVTYDKLNAAVVYAAGAISLYAGTPGNGLAVNVDGTTIAIVGNNLVAVNDHEHTNISTLDLFSDNGTILSWNGEPVAVDTEFIENIADNATTSISVCDITQIRAVHITYTLERNGFFATGNIKMLHDGANPGLETEYITLPTNSNLGINFNASISGNNLMLDVIADATGFTGILKYKANSITI